VGNSSAFTARRSEAGESDPFRISVGARFHSVCARIQIVAVTRDKQHTLDIRVVAAKTASMLTSDMRAVIDAAHLCFAATVTPEGRPNVSPKGTIRVWDDARLFFLDIASPGTRANLTHSPWMEINVVDQLSRRGYRFYGRAELHAKDSNVYVEAMHRLGGALPPTSSVEAVVLLTIERVSPLLSPAYWWGEDETSLRRAWRARREALDRAFEEHIARIGATRAIEGGKAT
jgi:predicted pyridoxine 5'-phosphate oxidase superfamily flavin-nucleotide-binding protein